jgi:hypothetical protein
VLTEDAAQFWPDELMGWPLCCVPFEPRATGTCAKGTEGIEHDAKLVSLPRPGGLGILSCCGRVGDVGAREPGGTPPSWCPRRRDRALRLRKEGVHAGQPALQSDLPAQASNRQSTRYHRRRQGLQVRPDDGRRESLTTPRADRCRAAVPIQQSRHTRGAAVLNRKLTGPRCIQNQHLPQFDSAVWIDRFVSRRHDACLS